MEVKFYGEELAPVRVTKVPL